MAAGLAVALVSFTVLDPELLVTVANIAAIIGLSIMITLYTLRTDWWRGHVGRSTVALKTATLVTIIGVLLTDPTLPLTLDRVGNVVLYLGLVLLGLASAYRAAVMQQYLALKDPPVVWSVSDDRIALIEATIRSEAINARARGDVYRAAGLDEAAGIVDAVTESVDAGTIGDDSNAREGSQG